MRVSTVYIATYKHDMRLTRICVASVRYWHPSVDICLIKDFGAGSFDTRELEDAWNVRVLDTNGRKFGWGFSKLEPLFRSEKEKFLILDSDTVFAGPVLDAVDTLDEDFIVDDETQPPEEIRRLYFDASALRKIDPDFKPCGKNFNSGQWIGTSGLLRRDDFNSVVDWSEPPQLRYPEIFMPGDQGILNYLLEKFASDGRFSLSRTRLMLWAKRDIEKLSLADLNRQSPYHQVIHWAGCKLYSKESMPRADILRFFERQYYARIPGGLSLCWWRLVSDYSAFQLRRVKRRLKL